MQRPMLTIDTPAHSLRETQNKTDCQPLSNVKIDTVMCRPTRRLTQYQRQKARHLGQRLLNVVAEALFDKLADTLAEAVVKTLSKH